MDLDPSATRRGHAQIAVALLLSIVIGAVVGAFLLDAEWTLARRVLVGTAIGAWCGLMVTARRLMM